MLFLTINRKKQLEPLLLIQIMSIRWTIPQCFSVAPGSFMEQKATIRTHTRTGGSNSSVVTFHVSKLSKLEPYMLFLLKRLQFFFKIMVFFWSASCLRYKFVDCQVKGISCNGFCVLHHYDNLSDFASYQTYSKMQ